MVQFIADHRAVFGVEPICAVLPIACVATLRLEAAVWSIGRRLRSGTATDVPSGRR